MTFAPSFCCTLNGTFLCHRCARARAPLTTSCDRSPSSISSSSSGCCCTTLYSRETACVLRQSAAAAAATAAAPFNSPAASHFQCSLLDALADRLCRGLGRPMPDRRPETTMMMQLLFFFLKLQRCAFFLRFFDGLFLIANLEKRRLHSQASVSFANKLLFFQRDCATTFLLSPRVLFCFVGDI